jgi:uncharacterized protein
MATDLKATHPSETSPGRNDIVVKSVQYGLQPMIMEKDVSVPVRDGHKLYANVIRPAKEGKYPVIIAGDCYGKDSIHIEFARNIGYTLGGYDCSQFAAWEGPDPGFWVPNGYVVVKLGLRGNSGSVGKVEPLSWQEARDYHDAIEWAGVQPWSNGNVGMNGVSYLAMCQWRVAQLNPPHLKAMIPWEGISDMYREWSFHGGIPETHFSRQWIIGIKHRNTPGSEIEDLSRMEREHPLFDEYWDGKRGKLEDIRVPMYVGASWTTQGLHTRGTIQGYRDASSKQKWIEIHGRKEWETYYGREALERQKCFLDYFLKGVDNGWTDTPRVRIEVRERFYHGLNRYENEFPIARTLYTPLYLDSSGSMKVSKPNVESSVSYDSTVALKYESMDGRVFFEHRFERDTELTGYMKLRLWVSTDASDDLDIFLGVHKLGKNGREVFLADFNHIENGKVSVGWLRVSHRELDEKRTTPYQPWLKHERLLKIKPNEIVPVDIEILPTSALFRAGESIRLSIQGSEVPRTAIPPLPEDHSVNRYAHKELVNKGKHIIHFGGTYDSHLLIPVIPPAAV